MGRSAALALGLWGGWLAVFLLGMSGAVRFPPPAADGGVASLCARLGYPKARDYVWYGAAVAGGLAGAAASLALRARLRAAGWKGAGGTWAGPAGVACAGTATALAFSLRWGESPVVPALAGLGLILPWFMGATDDPRADRGEPPPGPPPLGAAWILPGIALAGLWTADSCASFRPLDGSHEGGMLLFVQSALSGEAPGLDVHGYYGPLLHHSLAWWMRAIGLTVDGERWYFLAAQWSGTAAHLAAVGLLCRGGLARAAGAWLVLTVTTAPNIQYGWANALRTGMPLLGFALLARAVRGNRRAPAAAAGALAGTALLYSQEFGIAGAAASLALVGLRVATFRTAVGPVLLAWGAGLAGAAACWLLLMFGPRAFEGAARLAGGGYAAGRLLGHGALPLPEFPWWTDLDGLLGARQRLIELAAIWGPGLLACAAAAAAWAGLAGSRAGELAALAALTLLCQAPAIARPSWQIASVTPAGVLLAAACVDALRGRLAALAAAAGLAGYGWLVVSPMWPGLATRAACLGAPPPASGFAHPRLGRVRLTGPAAAETRELLRLIGERTRPGDRLYLGAYRHLHLAFLSDRAAVGPFPATSMAVGRDARRAAAAALERALPPLALLGPDGVDLSYAEEHPEEMAAIRRRYRLLGTVGEVSVFVPAAVQGGASATDTRLRPERLER